MDRNHKKLMKHKKKREMAGQKKKSSATGWRRVTEKDYFWGKMVALTIAGIVAGVVVVLNIMR